MVIVKPKVDWVHDERIILLEVPITTLGPCLPVLRQNLLFYKRFGLVLARFRHHDDVSIHFQNVHYKHRPFSTNV